MEKLKLSGRDVAGLLAQAQEVMPRIAGCWAVLRMILDQWAQEYTEDPVLADAIRMSDCMAGLIQAHNARVASLVSNMVIADGNKSTFTRVSRGAAQAAEPSLFDAERISALRESAATQEQLKDISKVFSPSKVSQRGRGGSRFFRRRGSGSWTSSRSPSGRDSSAPSEQGAPPSEPTHSSHPRGDSSHRGKRGRGSRGFRGSSK